MLTNLLNILLRIGLPRLLFFLGGALLTVAVPSLIIANKVSIQEPIDLQPAEVIQRLQQDYPNWKESLPSCPCTTTDAEASEDFTKGLLENVTFKDYYPGKNYHPGAAVAFRSTTPKEYRPEGRKDLFPLMIGQQCTYDSDGKLITHGPGAGTPDAYGSNGTDYYVFTSIGKRKISGLHTTFDVNTHKALGWAEYNKIWTPNNGNKCSFNPSPATPQELKQVSKLLAKGVLPAQGLNIYIENWVDTIRVFRNDDLNGSPRTLYEVKTRNISKHQGQMDEKSQKVWVQCSKQHPLIVYHPGSDDTITDPKNPPMSIQTLAPGSFVPMAYIYDNQLYWGVCHDRWQIPYSFYESEAKQYGYSPQLSINERVISQSEFIEAIYK